MGEHGAGGKRPASVASKEVRAQTHRPPPARRCRPAAAARAQCHRPSPVRRHHRGLHENMKSIARCACWSCPGGRNGLEKSLICVPSQAVLITARSTPACARACKCHCSRGAPHRQQRLGRAVRQGPHAFAAAGKPAAWLWAGKGEQGTCAVHRRTVVHRAGTSGAAFWAHR